MEERNEKGRNEKKRKFIITLQKACNVHSYKHNRHKDVNDCKCASLKRLKQHMTAWNNKKSGNLKKRHH